MKIRYVCLRHYSRKIKREAKTESGYAYFMVFFVRNNERESDLCRGPGDQLVGVPEHHCESLKKDTIIVDVSAFDASWHGRERIVRAHARDADLREVRYARGVVGHGMVDRYSRHERVKGALLQ